jgi:DNA-binding NarL/FixJ family response regulator
MLSVVLVEHPTTVRRALRQSLHAQAGIRVVGEAGTVAGGLRIAERIKPDVVLLDAEMTDVDLPQTIQAFRVHVPHSTLLVITLEPDRLTSGLHADGAITTVGKVGGSEALLAALRRLAKQQS